MTIPGQTLFLGASVISFSSNIGWGGGTSSITVELVEDFQPFGRPPFRKFNQNKTADYGELDTTSTVPVPSGHPYKTTQPTYYYNIPHYKSGDYPDNHYYECVGDDCYVDELGEPYGTSTTKKEKNVPGKIYYQWVNNRFVSKYWFLEDPGFFAVATKVQPNGNIRNDANRNLSFNTPGGFYVYDIINTPVYFKFDNFEFIGLVRSWERNNRPGGITYSVTIESFDSLLDSCSVILDKYGGSIFGSQAVGAKGTPINDINLSNFTYTGKLSQGSIPNIFNVFGFLESFGMDFFGGSNYNDNGLKASDVIKGLSVLTSAHSRYAREAIFSPFGRILTKSLADSDGNLAPNIMNFGIISPNVGTNRQVTGMSIPPGNHNAFSLDLSELDVFPPDFRISGSQSISDLLRVLSDATGADYMTRVVPAMINSATGTESLYQFVIKVITVDRTSYRSPYNIRSIVSNLENQNYNISNSSFGQETNNNITNKFIIGGPQQRLLQVKNYRLSHTQTNYIYNPMFKKFVSLNKPWSKSRVPSLISTRNQIISNLSLGPYIGNRINITDTDRLTRFSTLDNSWKDTEVAFKDVNAESIVGGNYQFSILYENPFESHISNSGDLNPDVKAAEPNILCWNPLPLMAQSSLSSSSVIDSSCMDYTPQPCPIKNTGEPLCKDSPQSWTDPTQDTMQDFESTPQGTGFIPVLGYDLPGSRYINLQNDFICPYFGRTLEQSLPLSDDTNEFRTTRPVFLDIWTNQIVVGFELSDLPQLSIGEPLSLYEIPAMSGAASGPSKGGLSRTQVGASTNPRTQQNSNQKSPDTTYNANWTPTGDPKRNISYTAPGFVVTESEMRAALVSFDSYLMYCLGKSKFSKPDLFLMLLAAYQNTGSVSINTTDINTINNTIQNNNNGLTRGPTVSSNTNIVSNGVTSIPNKSISSNLQMNWALMINHNFLKDMDILYNFIKNIADTYYGKKYLVKLPDLLLYRDQQYSSIRIPGKYNNISVYTGSNKLFYNYELAGGAWEEYGNYIDDCIVVGDNFSKILSDDNGLISPIVGYNNSLNIDDVRKQLCELSLDSIIQTLFGQADIFIQGLITAFQGIKQSIEDQVTLWNEAVIYNHTDEAAIRKQIQTSLERIVESNKKNIEVISLKQLQLFGGSIDCLDSFNKSKIFDAWNGIYSSVMGTIDTFGDSPSQQELSQLPDKWKNISTTQKDIIESAATVSPDLKFGVPSLDISSLSAEENFIIVPVASRKEPFDRESPKSSKLFTKCNTEGIIFLNISNFTDPRAIVNVSRLTVHDSSFSYSQDPGNSLIANIAIEDSAIYIALKNRLNELRAQRNAALRNQDNAKAQQILSSMQVLKEEINYIRFLKNFIVPEIDRRFVLSNKPSANPSVNHHRIHSRAAHPHFFGIPLKSNQYCYGPWSNYADNIVTTPYIDNLIHKSHVEYNSELVPWAYGGTSALDKAVAYLLNTDVNYQTIIENGRISIIGPPIFGLGGVFNDTPNTMPSNAFKFDNSAYRAKFSPANFIDIKRVGYFGASYNCIKLIHRGVSINGPLISNIGIQVGNEGVTTTYSFQTYNPKTGLFNKTYSDALQEAAKDRNKFEKSIADLRNLISNRSLEQKNKIINDARTNRSEPKGYSSSSLYGKSPIEIFVGQSTELLKDPILYTGLDLSSIKDVGDYPVPIGTSLEDKIKLLNQRRHYAWVGASMGNEIGAELLQEYNNKAAMSLDGLLSPVSFYPTNFGRTYAISSYVGGSGVPIGTMNSSTACPLCLNKRLIKSQYIDYTTKNPNATPTEIDIPCPACSKAKISVNTKDINLYSLNPIVVSSGEFRNPHATGIDRCRHSISVVGRGEYNPTDTSFYISDNINTYVSGYNPDFSKFDTKVKQLQNLDVLLNQRFFALRGPLMMHGWGFDKDDKPIPNADDMEYKIDTNGRPLRFRLVTNGIKVGQNDLEKPGSYLPITSANGLNPGPLGDIITKRYKWQGSGDGTGSADVGKWQKKSTLSNYFYLNWAERPDKWPVGPIDIRWDDDRKVWSAAAGGCSEEIFPPFIISNKSDVSTLNDFLANRSASECPYKMIYITLEQDMTKEDNFYSTNPTRGFIDDLEYSKEPLQDNYRRLVYVIDTAGYTAPRGAKLLCRYNKSTGFYEPITKPILTALGRISNNRVNIQMSYTQGRRAGVTPTYVSNFTNPLNLSIGSIGLFNYVDGNWTLVNTR